MATFIEEFASSPRVAFVLLGVLLVGTLLNFIGFASPYWSQDSLHILNAGLWLYCIPGLDGRTKCHTTTQTNAQLDAVRAMMVMSVLASIVSAVVLLILMFSSRFKLKKVTLIVLIASVAAAVFTIIGIAIFGAYGAAFAWAFYLCCVAAALFAGCSVLAWLVMRELRI